MAKFTALSTLGPLEEYADLLKEGKKAVGLHPSYEYVNNKKTDNILGYVYTYDIDSDDEYDGLEYEFYIPKDVLDLSGYGEDGQPRRRIQVDAFGGVVSINYTTPKLQVKEAHFVDSSEGPSDFDA